MSVVTCVATFVEERSQRVPRVITNRAVWNFAAIADYVRSPKVLQQAATVTQSYSAVYTTCSELNLVNGYFNTTDLEDLTAYVQWILYPMLHTNCDTRQMLFSLYAHPGTCPLTDVLRNLVIRVDDDFQLQCNSVLVTVYEPKVQPFYECSSSHLQPSELNPFHSLPKLSVVLSGGSGWKLRLRRRNGKRFCKQSRVGTRLGCDVSRGTVNTDGLAYDVDMQAGQLLFRCGDFDSEFSCEFLTASEPLIVLTFVQTV
jgi:hypothetical protein